MTSTWRGKQTSAEGKPAESSSFDRVIRPAKRESQEPRGDGGIPLSERAARVWPAFATKFVATNLKGLRDEVAHEFLSKSTVLPNGAEILGPSNTAEKVLPARRGPRNARCGVKGTKEYSYYDPTQGENFPTPAEGRYLGPKEIVRR